MKNALAVWLASHKDVKINLYYHKTGNLVTNYYYVDENVTPCQCYKNILVD